MNNIIERMDNKEMNLIVGDLLKLSESTTFEYKITEEDENSTAASTRRTMTMMDMMTGMMVAGTKGSFDKEN